jgi:hypothetical protein
MKSFSFIEIPFNGWSRERLKKGSKRATSRSKRYGAVGQVFDVEDRRYQIDLVIRVPLWFVAENLYLSEGAESYDEFIAVWTDIHPRRGYRPDDMVWYHHFREVE